MKKTISILILSFLTLYTTLTFAKDETTKASFKVNGNCESCKKRIEKAAKTEGVKSAVWNIDTQILTVTFAPAKISVDLIQQNIAKAGHDTEKYKAEESIYKNLPQCCQYER